ncbi:MAG: HAD-IA family hydrolase [Alphaproteobacteria bacterium]|nr:HAD-IA family hydrolase [Alphaproteobacteria bacterium]
MTATELKLVVFDLDGTLVDSLAMIQQAMTGAAQGVGVASPNRESVRNVIGLPLRQAVANVFPGLTEQHWDELTAGYKRVFSDLIAGGGDGESLYPGAVECLEELNLAGFLLGIATGKGRRGLDDVLDRHGLGHHFATLQTSDFGPGKPHPDMLNRAMAEAGVSPSDTIMVGDTSFDMEMAKAAGAGAIGVDWGYHAVAGLHRCGADQIAYRFDEIVPAVGRLFNDRGANG